MNTAQHVINFRHAFRLAGLTIGSACLALGLSAANGTWTRTTTGGNWSDVANWQSGTIATGDGSLANFGTLNIVGSVAVNVDAAYTTGTIRFGDTTPATAGSWLLGGTGTLTLAAGAAVPAIEVLMPVTTSATIAAPLAGANGFTKSGTGVLVLAGPANITGRYSVTSGTLRIPAGGTLMGGSDLTVSSNMATIVDGGFLSVYHASTPTTINVGAGFVLNSGTASFGPLRSGSADGTVIRINGGVFNADTITIQRDVNSAASLTAGFIVMGGTATIRHAYIGSNNSWGHMSVQGGDVLATGTFVVGNQGSGSRGGAVQVTAGRLTVTDTNYGMILSKTASGGNANNIALLTLTGGVTTLEKLTFGYDATVVAGSGSLTMTGGTLFVGAGGMVKNGTPGMMTGIMLTSGRLGADDSWSTPLPVTLPASNAFTIDAADEFGVAHDIEFDGMVSGAGGFTKTGGGMLTLSATNNSFTGAMTLTEGSIRVSGQVVPGGALMTVPASTGLGGSGAIKRALNYASGATLLIDVDSISGALMGPQVTGGVNLGSALTITPIILGGGAIESGTYTILQATGGIAGNPTITWNYSSVDWPVTATFAKSADNNSIIATVVAPMPISPQITSPLTATGTAGFPFSYVITATNHPRGFDAINLPDGLVIDTHTGAISGATDVQGAISATIIATNRAGSDSKTLLLTFAPPPPATIPPVVTGATVTGTTGMPYSYQIVATTSPLLGYGPIIGYGAAPLPAGLSINPSTGLITGTILNTGSTSIMLSATNVAGTGTATLKFTSWAIPVITSATNWEAMIGEEFNYQTTADNNPTSFEATGVPDGFNFNTTTGQLVGTGTTVIVADITLIAKNSVGSDTKTLHMLIDSFEPRIISPLAVVVPVGTPVNYQTVATRNPTRYEATPLPPGFTFDSATGLLKGTLTADSSYSVQLVAENTIGVGVPSTLKVVAYGPPPAGSLLWTGSADQVSGTATWSTSVQNWKKGATPQAYADGQDLYFDDSSDTQRIVLASGTYSPSSMTFNVSSRTLTIQSGTGIAFSGSSTAPLTVKGSGTVVMAANSANGWQGVTRLDSGVLEIGAAYPGIADTAGNAGPIVFKSGTLMYNNTRNRVVLASYLALPEGSHGVLDFGYAYQVNSTLQGSGTLEIKMRNASGYYQFIAGDEFNGTLILSGTGEAQIPQKNGWSFDTLRNVSLVVEGRVYTHTVTNSSGNTFPLGALAGSSHNASIRGGANGPAGKPNTILRIGRKNLDTTYAGSIGDWAAVPVYTKAEVVKEGTGMLTFSGSHNYVFPTTVTAGALRITASGRLDGAASTSRVTVNPDAAFGGAGYVASPVTFQDSSAYLIDADPETNELGGLSVGGLVTFEGGMLEIKPVVTGTSRIANGVYTILFSESGFNSKPLLKWTYPTDAALNVQLEYAGDNRIQATVTNGSIPLPKIISGGRADAMVGQPFSYTITTESDPSSPVQYSAENLPPGLSLNPATGVISGTPTQFGIYNDLYADQGRPAIVLHASNVSGTSTKILTMIIYNPGFGPDAPVIASDLDIARIKSRTMRYQIFATGFPTRFSATGLPHGITIDADGLISGISETLGTYEITITASNLTGTDTKILKLKISLPPPAITSPAPHSAVQGKEYIYQLEAINEPTAYRLSPLYETIDTATITGTMVNYLTINSSGLMSGTCPNVATTGTSPLMVTGTVFVENDTGIRYGVFYITINPPDPVVLGREEFFGVVGVPFSYVISATNMYPAYKPDYGVTNIPPGLNVKRANGEIYGTPLAAGNFDVAFVATNATGAGAKGVRFTINGASALGTLTGNAGTPGTADGTLTAARFNAPGAGVADKHGNLYIADTGNNSIRKVAANGTVSTLTTGLSQPYAIVINAAGTTLYITDAASGSIKKIDTASGVSTTLVLAGSPALSAPHGLAIDASDKLYVADTGNNLVRKIDPVAGTLTTIAGSGAAGFADNTGATATFDLPTGIALSTDGASLFVADTGNHIIRAIDLGTSAVTTLAGTPRVVGTTDGIGAVARFKAPEGLAVDASGVLYVADTGNSTIRSIDTKARSVVTFAGTPGIEGNMDGNAVNSLLNNERGLTVDSDGEIYVFDTGNHTIRVLQVGPAIVTPPADQSAPLGSSVTMSVVASGGPLPTYQWYKDELLLAGATKPTLTLENVQLSDVAYYRVVVTNPLGYRSARGYLSISNASPSTPPSSGSGGGSGGGGGGGAPSAWYLGALALVTLMYRIRRHLTALFVFALGTLLFVSSAPDAAAQAVGKGTITGRVLNQATGQYLSNAQVTLEGTSIETLTDSSGGYRLDNVPVGTARISANYAGLDKMTKEVSVSSAAAATADFNMTAQVYVLEKFVVAGDREGSSRAVQEQRMATTQKAVFAADSFGNVVDSNIGELMKNLPGITIDYDGEDASTMRIRGMDPEFANITLDGNETASIGNTESRAFNLKAAALQNIEKIEINAAPTADQPANTMGGQVNIVTKSALSQKGRRLMFVANMSINTAELNFDKTPGGSRTPDRKLMPGFNVSWLETFGTKQRFGFAFDAGFARNYRYSNDYTLPSGYTYDTYVLAQNENKLTQETPGYVKALQWKERGGSSENRMVSLNLDYEPWGPNHSFYLKTSYNDTHGLGAYDRYLKVNAGSQADGSSLYNMISPDGVNIEVGSNVNAASTSTYSFNAGAKHKFGRLKVDYNGFYSQAETNPDPDENFYISYSTRGLGMNIFNLAGNGTGEIVQTSHDGQGVITPDDPRSYRNLANYDRMSFGQEFYNGTDERLGGKLNVTLPVVLRIPFTSHIIPIDIQAGGSYGEQSRKSQKKSRSKNMTGSSSEPGWTSAQPALTQFADPYFKNSWGFDVPIPTWVSPYLVKDFYDTTPGAFFLQDVHETRGDLNTYNEMINNKQTKESTTAFYGSLSARILSSFTLILGVRYEQLRTSGVTPKFLGMTTGYNYLNQALTPGQSENRYDTANALSERNPTRATRPYPKTVPKKDANGNDIPGQTVVVPGEYVEVANPYYGMYDVAAQTAALFNYVPYDYTFDGQYFPNIQFKWTTPIRNLTVRGARTTGIGRPKLSQVLAEQEFVQKNRKVTSGNPELKSQSSVKYDLSLEYSPTRDGLLNISFFRQDIKDYINEETSFFEVVDDITLANDIDKFYYDDIRYFPALMKTGVWTSATYINSGKGTNQGFEISYRQKLDIIHRSLRDFSFYGSFSYADPTIEVYRHAMRAPTVVTLDTLSQYYASPMVWETVPMPNIQKRSGTVQLSYTGRRIFARVGAYWVDTFARSIRTDILEITNQNAYLRFDLNLTYKINSRWKASFDWRNVTDVGDDRKIFDRTGGYFTSGMVMNVSVRADF